MKGNTKKRKKSMKMIATQIFLTKKLQVYDGGIPN